MILVLQVLIVKFVPQLIIWESQVQINIFVAQMQHLIYKEAHVNQAVMQTILATQMEFVQVNFYNIKIEACSTSCSSCTSSLASACTGCISGYALLNGYCC